MICPFVFAPCSSSGNPDLPPSSPFSSHPWTGTSRCARPAAARRRPASGWALSASCSSCWARRASRTACPSPGRRTTACSEKGRSEAVSPFLSTSGVGNKMLKKCYQNTWITFIVPVLLCQINKLIVGAVVFRPYFGVPIKLFCHILLCVYLRPLAIPNCVQKLGKPLPTRFSQTRI